MRNWEGILESRAQKSYQSTSAFKGMQKTKNSIYSISLHSHALPKTPRTKKKGFGTETKS